MNNNYRYQLERYRGRGTRYTCPQCGRKYTFTRYIDTENNNIYISENVGKCNRLDKCGYHYTPKQYYIDNPWKRDIGYLNSDNAWSKSQKHREIDLLTLTKPICTLPEWVVEGSINRVLLAKHYRLKTKKVSKLADLISSGYQDSKGAAVAGIPLGAG